MGKQTAEKGVDVIFRLKSFEILNFSTKIPKNKPKDFGYAVNIHIDYNRQKKEFSVTINLIAKKSKKSKKYYLEAKTRTIIEIENSEDIEELPESFENDMIASAYATTRGVILGKNEDNFISQTPLPLLDLNSLRDK